MTEPRDWHDWDHCLTFLASMMEAAEIADMIGVTPATAQSHLRGDTEPGPIHRRAYVYAARRLRGMLAGVEAAGYFDGLPPPPTAPAAPTPAGPDVDEPAGDGLPTGEERAKINERLRELRAERKGK